MTVRFPAAALAALFLIACPLEKPDPASQAAAILHKRPSGLLDRLAALDGLASGEWQAGTAGPGAAPARASLAESLYVYAARLRPALAASADPEARISLINSFLFDTLGILPAPDDTSLAASVPSLVLARRQGSCVGLVLLYLGLGEVLKLPLRPVFLPGHIFVRWRSEGLARNVETLKGGIARGDSFYRETFSLGKRPWYRLEDVRPEQALAALVFNLANLHRARGDWGAAEWEYRLTEELLPGLPEAVGNRGAGWWAAGDPKQARPLLEAALTGDSLSISGWSNLAAVYSALGDSALATQAADAARAVASAGARIQP